PDGRTLSHPTAFLLPGTRARGRFPARSRAARRASACRLTSAASPGRGRGLPTLPPGFSWLRRTFAPRMAQEPRRTFARRTARKPRWRATSEQRTAQNEGISCFILLKKFISSLLSGQGYSPGVDQFK